LGLQAPMNVRDFTFGDEAALHAVFYSAIHTIAARDYTPAQLDAWAPARPDMDRWTARMRAIRPFVVEEDGRIVGYADLQANGHIDHFYVSGPKARRGVGRILMDRIHSRAEELKLTRLFSDVSRTARPFFERFGFLVLERKTVVVAGVSLPNVRMTKELRGLGKNSTLSFSH
jgi:putative acetyltransferase